MKIRSYEIYFREVEKVKKIQRSMFNSAKQSCVQGCTHFAYRKVSAKR